ncbi:MAG: hypothetical protein F9K44_00690 [Hyphomicrobiaceae bacterium]|nr:MAG: hypothetical protein F9K44_00690 [Hyphomicrobiaceae bacterium]
MVLPAKSQARLSVRSEGEAPAEAACEATCHVEVEEGTGVNGNLLCFILFMGTALAIAEVVTETVLRPKFLFLAAVAAGVGLVALQDAWLQRRPKLYRLVIETEAGRKVVLESPSREAVEAAERSLSATLKRRAAA